MSGKIKVLVPTTEKGRYKVVNVDSMEPDKDGNIEVKYYSGKVDMVPVNTIKLY